MLIDQRSNVKPPTLKLKFFSQTKNFDNTARTIGALLCPPQQSVALLFWFFFLLLTIYFDVFGVCYLISKMMAIIIAIIISFNKNKTEMKTSKHPNSIISYL